jgi:hypothetical protein
VPAATGEEDNGAEVVAPVLDGEAVELAVVVSGELFVMSGVVLAGVDNGAPATATVLADTIPIDALMPDVVVITQKTPNRRDLLEIEN